MSMQIFKKFAKTEDGAVSLPWMMFGGVVTGLGVAVAVYMQEGSEVVSKDLDATLSDDSLPDQIFPGRTN